MAAEGRVLIVDDEELLLNALRRQLRGKLDFIVARSGSEALKLLQAEGPIAVVVSDMQMPGMNGIDLLRVFQEKSPDTTRIMLTGNADQKTAVEAVNSGRIFRFLNKPCDAETLAASIADGQRLFRLVRGERELLERTLAGSVKVLTDVLAMVDAASYGRTDRIRSWMRAMAKPLRADHPWQWDMAGMLYPIGHVAIPDEILAKRKNGKALSPDEREVVARVPEIGAELVSNIPRMAGVADIVLYQDKRFDGTGFPTQGKSGTNIPLGGRVLAVLKALDKVTEGSRPTEADLAMLQDPPGRFDPEVLAAAGRVLVVKLAEKEVKSEVYETLEIEAFLLRPGDVVETDVLLGGSQLILAKGNVMTQTQIQKFHNLVRLHRLKGPFQISRLTVDETETA